MLNCVNKNALLVMEKLNFDESYFGARRVRRKRGHGANFGMLKRGDKGVCAKSEELLYTRVNAH